MSCCQQFENNNIFILKLIQGIPLNAGDLGIILTLFLTGLSASFTHCISMCGPLAIAQTSMRLMHVDKFHMNSFTRIKCALCIPYYIGKSLAYTTLTLSAFIITENLKQSYFLKLCSIFLLSIVCMLFIKAGISKSFQIIGHSYTFKYEKFFINLPSRLKLEPFGFKGLIMGFILGFIPCAIVYSAIVTAVATADNLYIAIFSIVAFGFATIPGLFIVSYIGEYIISWNQLLFKYAYTLMMFINAYILFQYASAIYFTLK